MRSPDNNSKQSTKRFRNSSLNDSKVTEKNNDFECGFFVGGNKKKKMQINSKALNKAKGMVENFAEDLAELVGEDEKMIEEKGPEPVDEPKHKQPEAESDFEDNLEKLFAKKKGQNLELRFNCPKPGAAKNTSASRNANVNGSFNFKQGHQKMVGEPLDVTKKRTLEGSNESTGFKIGRKTIKKSQVEEVI